MDKQLEKIKKLSFQNGVMVLCNKLLEATNGYRRLSFKKIDKITKEVLKETGEKKKQKT